MRTGGHKTYYNYICMHISEIMTKSPSRHSKLLKKKQFRYIYFSNNPIVDRKSCLLFPCSSMILMIVKMYHLWGYKVIICIKTPKSSKTLFFTFLPSWSSWWWPKFCFLFQNKFCGRKDSKKLSYMGLQCQSSLINNGGALSTYFDWGILKNL